MLRRHFLKSLFFTTGACLTSSILVPKRAEARGRRCRPCSCSSAGAWYPPTRSIYDFPKGFETEDFPYYSIDGELVKAVYFQSATYDHDRWTNAVKSFGLDDNIYTLKIDAPSHYWRLDDPDSGSAGAYCLVLGLYNRTKGSIWWYGAWLESFEDGRVDWFTQGLFNEELPDNTDRYVSIPEGNRQVRLGFANPPDINGFIHNDIVYRVFYG